jgi:hypothetical protein
LISNCGGQLLPGHCASRFASCAPNELLKNINVLREISGALARQGRRIRQILPR